MSEDILTQRVVELEAKVEKMYHIISLLNASLKQLSKAPKQDDMDKVIYDRYNENKSKNRAISESNELIAVYMHYHHNKGVSARKLSDLKLVSLGKSYGLAGWDLQFVHDFIHVHGLKDIYQNASTMPDLIEKYPVMQELNKLLT